MQALTIARNLNTLCYALDFVDPYDYCKELTVAQKVNLVAVIALRAALEVGFIKGWSKTTITRLSLTTMLVRGGYELSLRDEWRTLFEGGSSDLDDLYRIMSCFLRTWPMLEIRSPSSTLQLTCAFHAATLCRTAAHMHLGDSSMNQYTTYCLAHTRDPVYEWWYKLPYTLHTDEAIPNCLHQDSLFSQYTCPISGNPIRDPVMDPDGVNIYERSAVRAWIAEIGTSPMTGMYLHPDMLIESPVLAQCISRRCKGYKQYWGQLRGDKQLLEKVLAKESSYLADIAQEAEAIKKTAEEHTHTHQSLWQYIQYIDELSDTVHNAQKCRLLRHLAIEWKIKLGEDIIRKLQTNRRFSSHPYTLQLSQMLDQLKAFNPVHEPDPIARVRALSADYQSVESTPLADLDHILPELKDDALFARFICPLTGGPIKTPICDLYGNIYEASAIMGWLEKSKTIGNGYYLSLFLLRPMPVLKGLIQHRLEQYDRIENPQHVARYKQSPIGEANERALQNERDQVQARALQFDLPVTLTIKSYDRELIPCDEVAGVIDTAATRAIEQAQRLLKAAGIDEQNNQHITTLKQVQEMLQDPNQIHPAAALVTDCITQLRFVEALSGYLRYRNTLPAVLERDGVLKHCIDFQGEIVIDPVIDPTNGQTLYERSRILKWLETHCTSPQTRRYLEPSMLLEAPATKALIVARLQWYVKQRAALLQGTVTLDTCFQTPADVTLVEAAAAETTPKVPTSEELMTRIAHIASLPQPTDTNNGAAEYRERLATIKAYAGDILEQTKIAMQGINSAAATALIATIDEHATDIANTRHITVEIDPFTRAFVHHCSVPLIKIQKRVNDLLTRAAALQAAE